MVPAGGWGEVGEMLSRTGFKERKDPGKLEGAWKNFSERVGLGEEFED